MTNSNKLTRQLLNIHSDNSANLTASDNSPNSFDETLVNLDLTKHCPPVWNSGRNLDSDGDMIGDAGDVSAFVSPPNYAGTIQQTGNQEYSTFFDVDGGIESIQKIKNSAAVIYNSNTSIELLPEFEVELGVTLEIKLDSCPD